MSDWITITGVRPYDGRYALDLDSQPITTREWGWIKRHAGYLPATLDRAALSDPEFVIVQAIIAAHRAGRVDAADIPGLVERFQDVDPFAAITYEAGADDDADPPPPKTDANQSSNGAGSTTGSANSDDPLSATGHPRSDTSASAHEMSVT